MSPIGGVEDVAAALARSERGGVLDPAELTAVAQLIEALAHARSAIERSAEIAPQLAGRAAALPDVRELGHELRDCFDAEGQIRDDVSSVLRESRDAIRRLGGELQRRMGESLHDREIAPHLSDRFVTVRAGRYVIPVRADARGHVPGIVHDASSSGTTVFVEPESAVPLNNRLREAELAAARETRRILRELSAAVGRLAPELRAGVAMLGALDLAFARGELARVWDATAPEVGESGTYVLPQLRHPLLPRDGSHSQRHPPGRFRFPP